MKINSVNPVIIWDNADKVVSFYENSLGFHVVHNGRFFSQDDPEGKIRVLENEAGFRIDIIRLESQKTPTHGIRMNVEDLDEILAVYEAEGFSVYRGPVIVDNSKRVLVAKDNGEPVMVFQHIK